MSAPCSWAMRASSATGSTSPVTLLAPVTASTATGRAGSRSAAVTDSRSASGDGGAGSVTTGATRRQGSRLAWCSTMVVSTTCPSGMRRQWARWLIASVVLRTKMTESVGRAPTKRPTVSRAAS